MDLVTLNETADRKRLKTGAKMLREKLSAETKNIIKLKVSQDTAYWELNEKLNLTVRDHEILQSNMVKVQMDYESLSTKYQEELRQRPEILNKQETTRKLCDIQEKSMNRLRATLQRNSADCVTLTKAYDEATATVAKAHEQDEKRIAAAVSTAREAQERARISDEHNARLSELVAKAQSQAENEAAVVQRLRKQQESIFRNLVHFDAMVNEKEKVIKELREQLQQVTEEIAKKNERQRVITAELEREAGAAAALRKAITEAETRNESSAREVGRLMTELSLTAAARDDAQQKADILHHQNQEAQSNIEDLKREMSLVVQKCEEIAKELDIKDQELLSLKKTIAELKEEMRAAEDCIIATNAEKDRERREYEDKINAIIAESAAEIDKERKILEERIDTTVTELVAKAKKEHSVFTERATAFERELNDRNANIAQLKEEIEQLRKQGADANKVIAELNLEIEQQRKETKKHIESAARELSEKSDTITRLMSDMAIGKDQLKSANATIENQKNDLERERGRFDAHVDATERKVLELDKEIAHLKAELNKEESKRIRFEEDVNLTKTELNTARADAARALEDVRRLEDSVRNKDNEAASQMKVILSLRSEKEKLQEKIGTLEDKIQNIQKIMLTGKAPPSAAAAAAKLDPPELDDNAMPAPSPPSYMQGLELHKTAPRKVLHESQRANMFQSEYMFSDSDSMNRPDHAEINRRFVALDRDIKATEASTKTKRKRLRKEPKSEGAAAPLPAAPVQLVDRNLQGRKFFKTRRIELDRKK